MEKSEVLENIRSYVLRRCLKSDVGMQYAKQRIDAGLDNAQSEYNAWAYCASMAYDILRFIDTQIAQETNDRKNESI
jgi:hypothetical protein